MSCLSASFPDSRLRRFGWSRWALALLAVAVGLALLSAGAVQSMAADSEAPSQRLQEQAASTAEPASADGEADEAQSDIPDPQRLLDALADAGDGREADTLARQIQRLWNQSGSDSVDLLMRRASMAMQVENYGVALDLLDSVIALAPDYAEGWNRRATVHYLNDDYARSIADVGQVLRLEPRHFGALIGIAIMLDEMDREGDARLFLEEALRVHPFLTGARERLEAIERRMTGSPI